MLNVRGGEERGLDTVLEELERVWAHFEAMNIRSLRQGRLLDYARILRAAIAGKEVLTRNLVNALCEIHDLGKSLALSHAVLERVRPDLPDLCGGDEIQTVSSPHHKGRTLTFELIVAEYFQHLAPVRLNTPTDITVGGEQRRMLVECKRPESPNSLPGSLVKAYKQLSKARSRRVSGLGVVAVDVSRLVNPDSVVMPPQSKEAAARALWGNMDTTVRSALPAIEEDLRRNARRDAEVHMILLYSRAAALDGKGCCAVVSSWKAEVAARAGTAEHSIVSSFIESHPTYRDDTWPAAFTLPAPLLPS